MTVCGALCAIMQFKSKCHFSFSTIVQLLQLLHLLCPVENKLPRSVYILRKFFNQFVAKMKRKQYCAKCHKAING